MSRARILAFAVLLLAAAPVSAQPTPSTPDTGAVFGQGWDRGQDLSSPVNPSAGGATRTQRLRARAAQQRRPAQRPRVRRPVPAAN